MSEITICSAFTPDCQYDNSTIILIGDLYCPKTKCSGKLCLLKKTFQSLGRSDYQRRQYASVCQVRNISFEDQTNFFFLSFGKGVYIFEENPRSNQDVIGGVYCPGRYGFNIEKCESFDSYVTTLRSIYGCGNCGAWWLVHKVLFMLQENLKTTKTEKRRFFFAKKMNLVPNKQMLLNVPFQSTNYRRKKFCVDNKVRQTNGEVYYRTSRNEKCVYFSTNKTISFSFYHCKKSRTICHVLNISLKDKNRQLCCLAVTVHIVLQERRVATTKKINHLHFWRNFSANQIQERPNLNQKKQKFFQLWLNRVDTPLVVQLTKTSFTFPFYTLPFYIKTTTFFQSPTKLVSGLSTLGQVQWLWL